MTIDERNSIKTGVIQNLILENREKLSVSGVIDVLSFDDQVVMIETELGLLTVKGEEGYTQYSSEVKLTFDELVNKLKTKYEDITIDFQNNEDIKILEYTDSNRVKTIKFGNHELSGVETRTILGLKSTNFELAKEGNVIIFKVKGYGHGVGMSQTGADAMAKEGSTAEDIINHFYTNIEIKDINSL